MNKRDLFTDQVFLGLQKKTKCALCGYTYMTDNLPGAISYKSILKLREKWGEKVSYPYPLFLYEKKKVCVFCSQFFEDHLNPHRKKKKPKVNLVRKNTLAVMKTSSMGSPNNNNNNNNNDMGDDADLGIDEIVESEGDDDDDVDDDQ